MKVERYWDQWEWWFWMVQCLVLGRPSGLVKEPQERWGFSACLQRHWVPFSPLGSHHGPLHSGFQWDRQQDAER